MIYQTLSEICEVGLIAMFVRLFICKYTTHGCHYCRHGGPGEPGNDHRHSSKSWSSDALRGAKMAWTVYKGN